MVKYFGLPDISIKKYPKTLSSLFALLLVRIPKFIDKGFLVAFKNIYLDEGRPLDISYERVSCRNLKKHYFSKER